MTEVFRDASKDAGYCQKCQKGYAIGPHVCPSEAEQRPSKELAYLEWRQRDDPHQDQPWALYLVAGGNDAWHLLNAPAPLEVRGASNEPTAAPMKMHVDYEWQKQRLESGGPAEECAAGGPSKPVTTGCIWEDCDQEAIYCAGHAREFAAPAPPPSGLRDQMWAYLDAIGAPRDGLAKQSINAFLMWMEDRTSETKSERTDKCFADCGDNCQCEKYPPQYCKGCSNTVDQCICTAGETPGGQS